MLTLGIETTAERLDLALATAGAQEARLCFRAGRQHGRRLAPAIRQILSNAGRGVAEVEAVAVDVGPGSYTGIRIGLSLARAFAQARQLPLVGITALEAVAASRMPYPGWVAVTLDARHSRIYAALYRGNGHGAAQHPLQDLPGPQQERSPGVYALDAWLGILRGLDGALLVVGSGAVRYRETWLRALPAAQVAAGWPSAAQIARLACLRLAAGDDGDPLAVQAVYLRAPAPERA